MSPLAMRSVSFSHVRLASSGGGGSASSRLRQLRQLTGHPVLACRQALITCHQDVAAAADWLKSRGADGTGRPSSARSCHGLLGVMHTRLEQQQGQRGVAVVELRCQTDFAVRNQIFQKLLASACEALIKEGQCSDAKDGAVSSVVPPEKLLRLPVSATVALSSAITQASTRIGEKVTAGGGLIFFPPPGSRLAVYCHPLNAWSPDGRSAAAAAPASGASASAAADAAGVTFTRYASGVAYIRDGRPGGREVLSVASARRLCQHIVGMRPRQIGRPGIDRPDRVPDRERLLIYQSFLMDENVIVGDWLRGQGVWVVDFFRAAARRSPSDGLSASPSSLRRSMVLASCNSTSNSEDASSTAAEKS